MPMVYEPPVGFNEEMVRYRFWIKSSRGTNKSEEVEVPVSWDEEAVRSEVKDWCSQFPAWHHGENSINYGFERVGAMKTSREQFTEMMDALFEAWEDRVAPGDAGKRPYSEQRAVIVRSETEMTVVRNPAALAYEAMGILSGAIRDYGPRAIYIMLSGGNDSRTVAVVANRMLRGKWNYRGAALIDTGMALREAHENVARYAAALECPLTVIRTPANYEAAVRKHGFPGAAQHAMMYRLLKERAVRILTRQAKSLPRDRVMLVSGVRQQESQRRMLLTDHVQKDGARVWVNPLFYWSTEERDAFMQVHDIERNPISGKICGSSGDCLCGAMAEEGELADLDYWYGDDPAVQRIHRLQEECAALGVPCKWGHKPNGKPSRNRRINRPMFLCVGCENKGHTEALEDLGRRK